MTTTVAVDSLTLLAAVRYALGRRTYLVHVVVRDVIANASQLSTGDRGVLLGNIEHAIASFDAGDPVDVRAWQSAVDALRALVEVKS